MRPENAANDSKTIRPNTPFERAIGAAIMFGFLALLAWAILTPAFGAEVEGVATLVDGDTLHVAGQTIRIFGIDAPEKGQKCHTTAGRRWDCGDEAIAVLAELVEGKAVSCDGRGQDGYGREIAVCRAGSVDVGAEMVLAGAAWAFVKYAPDYIPQEEEARNAGRGVWQGDNQTPWDYRAERWNAAIQEAPEGCPIKGNISANGKIYHPPWSPWYARTKINEKKGERWFCTEAEAIEAGWRAPNWR